MIDAQIFVREQKAVRGKKVALVIGVIVFDEHDDIEGEHLYKIRGCDGVLAIEPGESRAEVARGMSYMAILENWANFVKGV